MNKTTRTARESVRIERRLALIFAPLSGLLIAVIAAHWLLVLEPRLTADAASRSRALAQAETQSIERLLDNSIDPQHLRGEIQTALGSIVLLKDQATATPLVRRIALILDYDQIDAPPGSLDIAAGIETCAECFVAQVPIYHPRKRLLIGVATFHSSPEFLRRLVSDVRTRLLGVGAVSLLLIGLAWLGTSRLLRRLGESEASLRTLFEAAPFPMVFNVSGGPGIIRANAAAKDYLDLRRDSTGEFSSDAWRVLYEGGLPPPSGEPRETRLQLAGRADRWALVSAIPLRYADTPGLLVSLTDVSELKSTEEELRVASLTDGLTGLFNRRHLFRKLSDEIELAKRYPDYRLSVILLDLDHFKLINDTFGHGVGDNVLIAVGATLLGSIRDPDVAGRYGGEEFLVILPHTERTHAIQAAERIRSAIAALTLPEPQLRVTISAGVCEYRGGTLDAFIETADRRLYEAKEAGRDRVAG